MLTTKFFGARKKGVGKGLRGRGLSFLLFTLSFLISLPFEVWAKTEKISSFSLHLEEWLILEVISNNFQVKEIGQGQVQLEATITLGQPVFVRALLAVRQGKKVTLKAILSSLEKLDSEADRQLKWRGEGDVSGHGLIQLNESTVLAHWQDQGLKTGTIIFESLNENRSLSLRGIFTLISY